VLNALLLGLAAFLPGWAAMTFLALRIDRAGRVGTALALSPILGGAVVASFVRLGMGWDSATVSLLVLSAAVVALRRVMPRGTGPDLRGNGPEAAWLAALIAALVVSCTFVSEWWRIASDAWTHAPIVQSLRVHGLPPLDPWYAGNPLQYSWLYHAWVTGLSEITRVNPFTIMALLAIASLAAFALLAGHFAGRFHGRNAGGATTFVLLAMNGAFAFTLPLVVLQALVGQDAGPHVLARAFGGIATDAGRAEDLLRWFGAQTWFGNKFTNSTPLSLGLAAYAAWLGSFWRVLDRAARERRELLLFALLTAATGALHPVLFLSTCASVALWFGLVVLFARSQAIVALRLALAAAVGAAAPALYFAQIVAPSAGHLAAPFDLSLPKLIGLALSIAPALVFCGIAARPLARAGGARGAWLLFVGAMLVFTVALRLPGAWSFFTVDKTSYLAYVPLALTGGAAFAQWAARGNVQRVLALLILVPASALALGSRITDPRTAWHQPWMKPSMVELRRTLPREALLVVPPGDLDTPIFLQRDAFDMDKVDGEVRGYDPAELAVRHALIDTLYRTGRLDGALRNRLVRTGRPVYAVWPNQSGQEWMRRTPGVPLRKFTTSGMAPPWSTILATREYGGDYTLTPLTPSAKL
jgi:hypothetical protein